VRFRFGANQEFQLAIIEMNLEGDFLRFLEAHPMFQLGDRRFSRRRFSGH